MKKLIILLTVLVLVFSLAACGNKAADTGSTEEGAYTDGGTMPGGFAPVIMVNGKLYTWTRLAVNRDFLDYGNGTEVFYSGDGNTFLPEGYIEAGKISEITAETPTEDMQLMAGFEASGTVYTSEITPEVVYVLMTTDWFDSKYVRFASDDLCGGECIFYNGNLYRISIGTGISPTVEELPEECVVIGTLKYIGDDAVPAADLETNCVSDTYGKYIDGREVYADPNDNSVIYVYEHQYWAQGDYPAYLACNLWES
ncbi:MAG: hypothetical protein IJ017_07330 [Oscillospiraceae bacterium]|nr:hypothetical protein [Oscillospiraceae bacterium]